MKEELLFIENMSASYGDEDIISNIDLTVHTGEIVCIVGESGSGKSTLLKAVHGMDRVYMTGGTLRFLGQDYSRADMRLKRKLMGNGIGLIPQNPAGSFNPLRSYEIQFRETLTSHGRAYHPEEVVHMLHSVGLKDPEAVLKSRPYELSGGMNQRTAIAAAMLLAPKLLLCDEATSALDVTTAGIIVDELIKLNKVHHTAILMVTHHLGIARKMADTIGIMCRGELIEYGSADSVLNEPKTDYTRQLLSDVPRMKVWKD